MKINKRDKKQVRRILIAGVLTTSPVLPLSLILGIVVGYTIYHLLLIAELAFLFRLLASFTGGIIFSFTWLLLIPLLVAELLILMWAKNGFLPRYVARLKEDGYLAEAD